jgi:hypothetical protein
MSSFRWPQSWGSQHPKVRDAKGATKGGARKLNWCAFQTNNPIDNFQVVPAKESTSFARSRDEEPNVARDAVTKPREVRERRGQSDANVEVRRDDTHDARDVVRRESGSTGSATYCSVM